jgi:hypothetical protein
VELLFHNYYTVQPTQLGTFRNCKWKWGAPAEEMLYKNQPGFIKFALGENVKQANWGITIQLVFLKQEWV